MKTTVKGRIPSIVRNDARLYEGDLRAYFKIIFFNAKNLTLPYHNFQHMFYVLYAVYKACEFYRGRLTPRQMRNLLIAAMFHDLNHSGKLGPDHLNIERAIQGLRQHILEEDRPFLADIEAIIGATEFPYKVVTSALSLEGQIIRDADMSQSLNISWVQQVVIGLAMEWEKTPFEVLKSQLGFMHNHMKFYTDWGKHHFPPEDVAAKVAEVTEYLDLLDVVPEAQAA